MRKLGKSSCVLCYDASFEGFLSAVFAAYARHLYPADIVSKECVQAAFGQELLDIETDLALASRVRAGFSKKAGTLSFNHVDKAFRVHTPGTELALFAYIEQGMRGGGKTLLNPADPVVAAVEERSKRAENEAEFVRQFLRFELAENGVYVAVVNPNADVVSLVAGHFARRFNTQPFVIYDEVHRIAALYDTRTVSYVKSDRFVMPAYAQEEMRYQRLWKKFYDSLSNTQRFNPGLRKSQMPSRFWKNLTEMKTATSICADRPASNQKECVFKNPWEFQNP